MVKKKVKKMKVEDYIKDVRDLVILARERIKMESVINIYNQEKIYRLVRNGIGLILGVEALIIALVIAINLL